MRLLEQDGLIRTQHGLGRFISAAASLHVERPITAYESITTMLRELGYRPTTEVLSVRADVADADAAGELRCARGAPVLVVERVRTHKGEVLVYSIEVVPQHLFPELPSANDTRGSLNDLLAHHGHRPRMSTASVSARALAEPVPAQLRGKYDGPWLLITETCFTEDGTPVIFARDYHRGDIFSFNFSRR
jgi:GntR family transcriptional regulator